MADTLAAACARKDWKDAVDVGEGPRLETPVTSTDASVASLPSRNRTRERPFARAVSRPSAEAVASLPGTDAFTARETSRTLPRPGETAPSDACRKNSPGHWTGGVPRRREGGVMALAARAGGGRWRRGKGGSCL
jgi:hypothetical protein